MSANNALGYCRTSRAPTGFRLRGPWRIYIDPACPRGLGSLDISSTIIKPIPNIPYPVAPIRPLYYYVRQLTASVPSPL